MGVLFPRHHRGRETWTSCLHRPTAIRLNTADHAALPWNTGAPLKDQFFLWTVLRNGLPRIWNSRSPLPSAPSQARCGGFRYWQRTFTPPPDTFSENGGKGCITVRPIGTGITLATLSIAYWSRICQINLAQIIFGSTEKFAKLIIKSEIWTQFYSGLYMQPKNMITEIKCIRVYSLAKNSPYIRLIKRIQILNQHHYDMLT